MERFGHWVADLEASFSLGMTGSASSKTVPGVPAVTTPLLLKLELEAAFGRILEHLSELLPHVDSPMLLLNTVYSTLEAIRPSSKSEELKALIDIFMQSAAPLWSMLGDWINRGIPIPSSLTAVDDEYAQSQTDEERSLDPEFFIKRDRDVSWADEDFWEAGFIDGDGGWPIWLSQGDTREAVMECGKARGLLRGLVGSSGEAEDWPSLPEVLQAVQSVKPASSELVIAQAISSYLSPICQLIQYRLRRVLEEECGLQEHLDAIEGVTYMRGFVVLDGWSRWLTSQVSPSRKCLYSALMAR